MRESLICTECDTMNEFHVWDYDAHYDDDCTHEDCLTEDELNREIARVQRRYDRYIQQVHQILHVDQAKVSSLFADNCLQEPCMSLFQDLGSTLV